MTDEIIQAAFLQHHQNPHVYAHAVGGETRSARGCERMKTCEHCGKAMFYEDMGGPGSFARKASR